MGHILRRVVAFLLGIVFTITSLVGGVVGGAYYAYKNVSPIQGLAPNDTEAKEAWGDLYDASIEELLDLISNAMDPEKNGEYTFDRLAKEYNLDLAKLLENLGIDVSGVDKTSSDWKALEAISILSVFSDPTKIMDSTKLKALYPILSAVLGSPIDNYLSAEAQSALGEYTLSQLISADEATGEIGLVKAVKGLKIGSLLPEIFETSFDVNAHEYIYNVKQDGSLKDLTFLNLIGNVPLQGIFNIVEGGDVMNELMEGELRSITNMKIKDILNMFADVAGEEVAGVISQYTKVFGETTIADLFRKTESGSYEFAYDNLLSGLEFGYLAGYDKVDGAWVDKDGNAPTGLLAFIADISLGEVLKNEGDVVGMINAAAGDLSLMTVYETIFKPDEDGRYPLIIERLGTIKVSDILGDGEEAILDNLKLSLKVALDGTTLRDAVYSFVDESVQEQLESIKIVDALLNVRIDSFIRDEYKVQDILGIFDEAIGELTIGEVAGVEPSDDALGLLMGYKLGNIFKGIIAILNGETSPTAIVESFIGQYRVGDVFGALLGFSYDETANNWQKDGKYVAEGLIPLMTMPIARFVALFDKSYDFDFASVVDGIQVADVAYTALLVAGAEGILEKFVEDGKTTYLLGGDLSDFAPLSKVILTLTVGDVRNNLTNGEFWTERLGKISIGDLTAYLINKVLKVGVSLDYSNGKWVVTSDYLAGVIQNTVNTTVGGIINAFKSGDPEVIKQKIFAKLGTTNVGDIVYAVLELAGLKGYVQTASTDSGYAMAPEYSDFDNLANAIFGLSLTDIATNAADVDWWFEKLGDVKVGDPIVYFINKYAPDMSVTSEDGKWNVNGTMGAILTGLFNITVKELRDPDALQLIRDSFGEVKIIDVVGSFIPEDIKSNSFISAILNVSVNNIIDMAQSEDMPALVAQIQAVFSGVTVNDVLELFGVDLNEYNFGALSRIIDLDVNFLIGLISATDIGNELIGKFGDLTLGEVIYTALKVAGVEDIIGEVKEGEQTKYVAIGKYEDFAPLTEKLLSVSVKEVLDNLNGEYWAERLGKISVGDLTAYLFNNVLPLGVTVANTDGKWTVTSEYLTDLLQNTVNTTIGGIVSALKSGDTDLIKQKLVNKLGDTNMGDVVYAVLKLAKADGILEQTTNESGYAVSGDLSDFDNLAQHLFTVKLADVVENLTDAEYWTDRFGKISVGDLTAYLFNKVLPLGVTVANTDGKWTVTSEYLNELLEKSVNTTVGGIVKALKSGDSALIKQKIVDKLGDTNVGDVVYAIITLAKVSDVVIKNDSACGYGLNEKFADFETLAQTIFGLKLSDVIENATSGEYWLNALGNVTLGNMIDFVVPEELKANAFVSAVRNISVKNVVDMVKAETLADLIGNLQEIFNGVALNDVTAIFNVTTTNNQALNKILDTKLSFLIGLAVSTDVLGDLAKEFDDVSVNDAIGALIEGKLDVTNPFVNATLQITLGDVFAICGADTQDEILNIIYNRYVGVYVGDVLSLMFEVNRNHEAVSTVADVLLNDLISAIAENRIIAYLYETFGNISIGSVIFTTDKVHNVLKYAVSYDGALWKAESDDQNLDNLLTGILNVKLGEIYDDALSQEQLKEDLLKVAGDTTLAEFGNLAFDNSELQIGAVNKIYGIKLSSIINSAFDGTFVESVKQFALNVTLNDLIGFAVHEVVARNAFVKATLGISANTVIDVVGAGNAKDVLYAVADLYDNVTFGDILMIFGVKSDLNVATALLKAGFDDLLVAIADGTTLDFVMNTAGSISVEDVIVDVETLTGATILTEKLLNNNFAKAVLDINAKKIYTAVTGENALCDIGELFVGSTFEDVFTLFAEVPEFDSLKTVLGLDVGNTLKAIATGETDELVDTLQTAFEQLPDGVKYAIIGAAAVTGVVLYFVNNDLLVQIVTSALGADATWGEVVGEALGYTLTSEGYTNEAGYNSLMDTLLSEKVATTLTTGYPLFDNIKNHITIANLLTVSANVANTVTGAIGMELVQTEKGFALGNEFKSFTDNMFNLSLGELFTEENALKDVHSINGVLYNTFNMNRVGDVTAYFVNAMNVLNTKAEQQGTAWKVTGDVLPEVIEDVMNITFGGIYRCIKAEDKTPYVEKALAIVGDVTVGDVIYAILSIAGVNGIVEKDETARMKGAYKLADKYEEFDNLAQVIFNVSVNDIAENYNNGEYWYELVKELTIGDAVNYFIDESTEKNLFVSAVTGISVNDVAELTKAENKAVLVYQLQTLFDGVQLCDVAELFGVHSTDNEALEQILDTEFAFFFDLIITTDVLGAIDYEFGAITLADAVETYLPAEIADNAFVKATLSFSVSDFIDIITAETARQAIEIICSKFESVTLGDIASVVVEVPSTKLLDTVTAIKLTDLITETVNGTIVDFAKTTFGETTLGNVIYTVLTLCKVEGIITETATGYVLNETYSELNEIVTAVFGINIIEFVENATNAEYLVGIFGELTIGDAIDILLTDEVENNLFMKAVRNVSVNDVLSLVASETLPDVVDKLQTIFDGVQLYDVAELFGIYNTGNEALEQILDTEFAFFFGLILSNDVLGEIDYEFGAITLADAFEIYLPAEIATNAFVEATLSFSVSDFIDMITAETAQQIIDIVSAKYEGITVGNVLELALGELPDTAFIATIKDIKIVDIISEIVNGTIADFVKTTFEDTTIGDVLYTGLVIANVQNVVVVGTSGYELGAEYAELNTLASAVMSIGILDLVENATNGEWWLSSFGSITVGNVVDVVLPDDIQENAFIKALRGLSVEQIKALTESATQADLINGIQDVFEGVTVSDIIKLVYAGEISNAALVKLSSTELNFFIGLANNPDVVSEIRYEYGTLSVKDFIGSFVAEGNKFLDATMSLNVEDVFSMTESASAADVLNVIADIYEGVTFADVFALVNVGTTSNDALNNLLDTKFETVIDIVLSEDKLTAIGTEFADVTLGSALNGVLVGKVNTENAFVKALLSIGVKTVISIVKANDAQALAEVFYDLFDQVTVGDVVNLFYKDGAPSEAVGTIFAIKLNDVVSAITENRLFAFLYETFGDVAIADIIFNSESEYTVGSYTVAYGTDGWTAKSAEGNLDELVTNVLNLKLGTIYNDVASQENLKDDLVKIVGNTTIGSIGTLAFVNEEGIGVIDKFYALEFADIIEASFNGTVLYFLRDFVCSITVHDLIGFLMNSDISENAFVKATLGISANTVINIANADSTQAVLYALADLYNGVAFADVLSLAGLNEAPVSCVQPLFDARIDKLIRAIADNVVAEYVMDSVGGISVLNVVNDIETLTAATILSDALLDNNFVSAILTINVQSVYGLLTSENVLNDVAELFVGSTFEDVFTLFAEVPEFDSLKTVLGLDVGNTLKAIATGETDELVDTLQTAFEQLPDAIKYSIIGVAAVTGVVLYFVNNDLLVQIVTSALGEDATWGEVVGEALGYTLTSEGYNNEAGYNSLMDTLLSEKVATTLTTGYPLFDNIKNHITIANLLTVSANVANTVTGAIGMELVQTEKGFALGNEFKSFTDNMFNLALGELFTEENALKDVHSINGVLYNTFNMNRVGDVTAYFVNAMNVLNTKAEQQGTAWKVTGDMLPEVITRTMNVTFGGIYRGIKAEDKAPYIEKVIALFGDTTLGEIIYSLLNVAGANGIVEKDETARMKGAYKLADKYEEFDNLAQIIFNVSIDDIIKNATNGEYWYELVKELTIGDAVNYFIDESTEKNLFVSAVTGISVNDVVELVNVQTTADLANELQTLFDGVQLCDVAELFGVYGTDNDAIEKVLDTELNFFFGLINSKDVFGEINYEFGDIALSDAVETYLPAEIADNAFVKATLSFSVETLFSLLATETLDDAVAIVKTLYDELTFGDIVAMFGVTDMNNTGLYKVLAVKINDVIDAVISENVLESLIGVVGDITLGDFLAPAEGVENVLVKETFDIGVKTVYDFVVAGNINDRIAMIETIYAESAIGDAFGLFGLTNMSNRGVNKIFSIKFVSILDAFFEENKLQAFLGLVGDLALGDFIAPEGEIENTLLKEVYAIDVRDVYDVVVAEGVTGKIEKVEALFPESAIGDISALFGLTDMDNFALKALYAIKLTSIVDAVMAENKIDAILGLVGDISVGDVVSPENGTDNIFLGETYAISVRNLYDVITADGVTGKVEKAKALYVKSLIGDVTSLFGITTTSSKAVNKLLAINLASIVDVAMADDKVEAILGLVGDITVGDFIAPEEETENTLLKEVYAIDVRDVYGVIAAEDVSTKIEKVEALFPESAIGDITALFGLTDMDNNGLIALYEIKLTSIVDAVMAENKIDAILGLVGDISVGDVVSPENGTDNIFLGETYAISVRNLYDVITADGVTGKVEKAKALYVKSLIGDVTSLFGITTTSSKAVNKLLAINLTSIVDVAMADDKVEAILGLVGDISVGDFIAPEEETENTLLKEVYAIDVRDVYGVIAAEDVSTKIENGKALFPESAIGDITALFGLTDMDNNGLIALYEIKLTSIVDVLFEEDKVEAILGLVGDITVGDFIAPAEGTENTLLEEVYAIDVRNVYDVIAADGVTGKIEKAKALFPESAIGDITALFGLTNRDNKGVNKLLKIKLTSIVDAVTAEDKVEAILGLVGDITVGDFIAPAEGVTNKFMSATYGVSVNDVAGVIKDFSANKVFTVLADIYEDVKLIDAIEVIVAVDTDMESLNVALSLELDSTFNAIATGDYTYLTTFAQSVYEATTVVEKVILGGIVGGTALALYYVNNDLLVALATKAFGEDTTWGESFAEATGYTLNAEGKYVNELGYNSLVDTLFGEKITATLTTGYPLYDTFKDHITIANLLTASANVANAVTGAIGMELVQTANGFALGNEFKAITDKLFNFPVSEIFPAADTIKSELLIKETLYNTFKDSKVGDVLGYLVNVQPYFSSIAEYDEATATWAVLGSGSGIVTRALNVTFGEVYAMLKTKDYSIIYDVLGDTTLLNIAKTLKPGVEDNKTLALVLSLTIQDVVKCLLGKVTIGSLVGDWTLGELVGDFLPDIVDKDSAFANVLLTMTLREFYGLREDAKTKLMDKFGTFTFGEALGFFGYDASTSTDALVSSILGLKLNVFDGGLNAGLEVIMNTVKDQKIGAILGYTEGADGTWSNNGAQVTGILATIAGKTINQIADPDFFNNLKLGEALGYEERADGWYNGDARIDGIVAALVGHTIEEITEDPTSIVMDVELGDALGYTKQADGKWYNGTAEVTGIFATLADKTIREVADDPDGIVNSVVLGDALGYTKQADGKWYNGTAEVTGVMASMADKTIGDIANDPDFVNDMKLGDVIAIDDASHAILKALKDTKIGELSTAINDITLGSALGYTEGTDGKWYNGTTEVTGIMSAFAGISIGTMDEAHVKQTIETLTLGDVIEINDASHSILKALKDTQINALSSALDDLTVGDALGYTEQADGTWSKDGVEATGIMGAFVDVSFGNLNETTLKNKFNTLTLKDVITITSDNKILYALKDTTLENLSDSISNMKLGTVMGYTEQTDGWYNGTTKVTDGLALKLADKTVIEVGNGNFVNDLKSELTLGDLFPEAGNSTDAFINFLDPTWTLDNMSANLTAKFKNELTVGVAIDMGIFGTALSTDAEKAGMDLYFTRNYPTECAAAGGARAYWTGMMISDFLGELIRIAIASTTNP